MKRYIFLFVMIAIFTVTCSVTADDKDTNMNSGTEKSIYDFTVQDITGKDVKMSDYKGKTLLIVNVASQCGFTYQYEGMQKVYEKYQKDNFVVLGFPTNDFGAQEPGSNEEIQTFCTSRFSVTFPMFAKIVVKGSDKHELYKFLTEKETNPEHSGEISWNFNKFLISPEGEIVARYSSRTKPESEEVTSKIEELVKQK